MYDQKLADRILEVLNERYPEKVQSERELQSRLTEYQGTPEEEWFNALDALHGDGLIDGKFLRSGMDQKVEAAASLSITRAGREQLRAKLTLQGSSSSVREPAGGSRLPESYDFWSMLPETPTIPESISAELANLLVCAFERDKICGVYLGLARREGSCVECDQRSCGRTRTRNDPNASDSSIANGMWCSAKNRATSVLGLVCADFKFLVGEMPTWTKCGDAVFLVHSWCTLTCK